MYVVEVVKRVEGLRARIPVSIVDPANEVAVKEILWAAFKEAKSIIEILEKEADA